MSKIKLFTATCIVVCALFNGCNLFNPTESVNVKSDDACALTFEGYVKFRDNKYSEALKYFNKAIAADSTHSEAWLGLIKSMLNEQGINAFELLPYVNATHDGAIPFANMSDSIANKYQTGIDSVTKYAKIFIEKDTTNKLDGKVGYKNISDGYIVIQMMQTMLIMRKTTQSMPECDLSDSNSCDMKSVLNKIQEAPGEALESFHEVFNVCSQNPSSMSNLFDQYLQGFDSMEGSDKNTAIGGMCNALAQETDNVNEEAEQQKVMNIINSQLGYSGILDEDGDGCFDEEIYDGEDNDGDGEIDEDVRNKTNDIIYDTDLMLENALKGNSQVKDMMIVKTAAPNNEYKNYDLDLNGINADADEWTFVYNDYNDRVKNKDHRLVFAKKLNFNPQKMPIEKYIEIKHAVAADTDINNIKYDLEYRKKVIGACWENYDEIKFKKWFEGRIK